MKTNMQCRLLCGTEKDPSVWSDKESADLYYMVNQEYFIHLIMDNLPCATQFKMPDTQEVQFEPGFRLGFVAKEDDKKYINNHLRFIVSYHQVEDSSEDQSYRVVGFRVETTSVDKGSYEFSQDGGCTIKDNANHQEITDNKENK
jgi:transmembrane 9 superfamily protein 2/4